jgi:hypothetical protein
MTKRSERPRSGLGMMRRAGDRSEGTGRHRAAAACGNAAGGPRPVATRSRCPPTTCPAPWWRLNGLPPAPALLSQRPRPSMAHHAAAASGARRLTAGTLASFRWPQPLRYPSAVPVATPRRRAARRADHRLLAPTEPTEWHWHRRAAVGHDDRLAVRTTVAGGVSGPAPHSALTPGTGDRTASTAWAANTRSRCGRAVGRFRASATSP